MNKLIIGRIGEEAAAEYLIKNGYRVVERNHRTRWHEIDIVAQKNDHLVFIEVRTKDGTQFGTPEETIDCKKLGRVIKAADCYAAINAPWCKAWRIDAVCVVLSCGKVERLTHYENITL